MEVDTQGAVLRGEGDVELGCGEVGVVLGSGVGAGREGLGLDELEARRETGEGEQREEERE